MLVKPEQDAAVSGIYVHFSSNGSSTRLNRLYPNNTMREILQGEIYRAVNKIFQTIGTCIDRAIRFQNEVNMTDVHRMYPDRMSKVVSQNYGRKRFMGELETLLKNDCLFKHIVVNIFRLSPHPDYLHKSFTFGPSDRGYFKVFWHI